MVSAGSAGAERGLGRPPSNSSQPDTGSEPPNLEFERPDVPTPQERVSEFKEELPRKAFTPLALEDGTKLRAECVEEETVQREVTPEAEHADPFEVRETFSREALPMAAAMEEFLEWYEENRGLQGKFGRGRERDGDRETFTVHLDNSFQPGSQQEDYAQLRGLFREIAGGERPSGGAVGGKYEEPATIMISRTASSTDEEGEPIPPVEHDRAIQDAWSGSGGVYRTLYHQLKEAGLKLGEHAEYHKQAEPHPGGGAATGYSHEHAVILVDLAATDKNLEELAAAVGEAVIDKHVEVCDGAEFSAHDYTEADSYTGAGEDSPIAAQRIEDLEDPAGYICEYVATDGETDLLERPPEYLMWATTQWATNTQKGVRSNGANAAVKADKCKQAYERPHNDQLKDHGEQLRHAEPGAHHEIECACCGSPWGIDQEQTITQIRLEEPGAEPSPASPEPIAADGGVQRPDPDQPDAVRDEEARLRGIWRDARSGGVSRYDGLHAAFKRRPRWRFEAVITSSGEEHPASRSGGVDMRPLRNPWVELENGERIKKSEVQDKGPPLEPGEMMWPENHPDYTG